MVLEVLQDIGLSPNESKIYLSLLESGVSGVTKISRDSGLHRANVYDSLKRLSKKSLVSKIDISGSSKFEANDPRVLSTVLNEKKSRLDSIMPKLQLHKNLSKKNSTQIIEGLNGFRSLLNSLLFSKSAVLSFGSFPKSISHFFIRFENECSKQNISFDNIPSDSPLTIVSGTKVIIVLWDDNISSVSIDNEALADSYRLMFTSIKNIKTAS
ncbi:MAG: helix-turn-helix domain-containing protein [Patescibacteria group bacterium]|nr:helix-turn-helix domain-containing protein [Patescibacteria group bacterium]